MSKRQLIPILRQSLLICHNAHKQYLLVGSASGLYSLPLFQSQAEETFRQGLMKGVSLMKVRITLEGVFRVQSGRKDANQYYRCIYYAKTQDTPEDSLTTFKKYEEIEHLGMSQYDLDIIKEFHQGKVVHSLDFFRQNHLEQGPIDSSRTLMFSI